MFNACKWLKYALVGFVLLSCLIITTGIVRADVTFREFSSIEDLQAWLQKQPLLLIADSTGYISLTDTCTYAADALQRKALTEGYLMSVQLVQDGYLLGQKVVENKQGSHMGNLVIIGRNIYYIEPETKKITLIGKRGE